MIAGLIVALAALAAYLVERRRRPEAPTQGRGPDRYPVPVQLDRADFAGADRPWLVAVFTSATCDSCRATMDKAAALASNDVVVEEVEVGARGDLHARYGIEAVPTTVVADVDGVVRASVVGPVSAADLWSTVAEVRGAADGATPAGSGDA